jgi:hypothetical protein
VTNIGSQHPLPENIPHIHNAPQSGSKDATTGSPIKEASHPHLKSPMASEEPITGESIAKEIEAEEREEEKRGKMERGEEQEKKEAEESNKSAVVDDTDTKKVILNTSETTTTVPTEL